MNGGGQPASKQSMRRHNLALVLRQVAASESASRATVAARVGLTKATVSSLVEELRLAGLVIEHVPENQGRVGRPGGALALNPRGAAGVGVEVNVDYTAVCVADLTGAPRVRLTERADNRGRGAEETLHSAGRLAARACAAARRAGLAPVQVTLGVPGLVHDDRVLHAPNLDWRHVPAGDLLVRGLGRQRLAVSVDNEANLAAIGEFQARPPGAGASFLYVSGEIGIGAGLMVDGELFRGGGFAGEIGHVTVIPDGPECGCGARGCLERYAGQDALLEAAALDSVSATRLGSAPAVTATATRTGGGPGRHALQEAPTEGSAPVERLAALAAEGDDAAVRALAVAGRALGVALSGAVNLLDPPEVVIGGIYARLAPWLIPSLQVQLHERVTSGRWRSDRLRVSGLGTEAAVRGAAGAGVQAILRDPSAYIDLTSPVL
ncbi:ROK family transcriptional regulator [Actinacidiphila paucisporea]|uniref:Sugar kinase of the NBD/HSP70 family, may contain an N-terminal HTH domain n=1 Tax=Actinacidiphila paucisporea TaxID=310782 RepID=A0A1M7N9V8_9ACTN|nr:ROK family transcriptional regulator [Actinacidiphila paucisporea]SHN00398.1 Sugar kinase of the NBD/HSP70 family, may contain an N-terminal HTH domain [Actinacidiphila paucisporea]